MLYQNFLELSVSCGLRYLSQQKLIYSLKKEITFSSFGLVNKKMVSSYVHTYRYWWLVPGPHAHSLPCSKIMPHRMMLMFTKPKDLRLTWHLNRKLQELILINKTTEGRIKSKLKQQEKFQLRTITYKPSLFCFVLFVCLCLFAVVLMPFLFLISGLPFKAPFLLH